MKRLISLFLFSLALSCSRQVLDKPLAPDTSLPPIEMPEEAWPFAQPKNTASITLRRIAFDRSPILYVTHDRDDHGWQFLDMDDAEVEDMCLVGLGELHAMDSTVAELSDMPPGWRAWRNTPAEPWQRALNPNDPE